MVLREEKNVDGASEGVLTQRRFTEKEGECAR